MIPQHSTAISKHVSVAHSEHRATHSTTHTTHRTLLTPHTQNTAYAQCTAPCHITKQTTPHFTHRAPHTTPHHIAHCGNQIKNVFMPVWKGEDEKAFDEFEKMLFLDIMRSDRVGRFYNLNIDSF